MTEQELTNIATNWARAIEAGKAEEDRQYALADALSAVLARFGVGTSTKTSAEHLAWFLISCLTACHHLVQDRELAQGRNEDGTPWRLPNNHRGTP